MIPVLEGMQQAGLLKIVETDAGPAGDAMPDLSLTPTEIRERRQVIEKALAALRHNGPSQASWSKHLEDMADEW